MKKFLSRLVIRYYFTTHGNRYHLHKRKIWSFQGIYDGVTSRDRDFMVWLVDYMNGGR